MNSAPVWIELLEPRRFLAVSLPSGFSHVRVANAIISPTALATAPDGRIFVTQQDGKIRVIKNDALLSTPFASVPADVFNERGLLGITFDPDYATNKYIYIYYTSTQPTSHNRLSRFTATGDVASGGETILLDLPNVPSGTRWHMGGGIHFGADGKLYIAVGDHEDTSKPQSLSSPFGKILRINKDGTIPTDNPFYSQTSGINRAIWARGLRNPYTFGIQPTTGKILINDVGQESYEEINLGQAGGNYGWPQTEGPFSKTTFPQYVHPLYWYSHSNGCAITGGSFYNPTTSNFPSTWVGKYFWVDFCTGTMRALDSSSATNTTFATGLLSPTDIQVRSDGSMYYISRNDTDGEVETLGSVWKIRYTASSAPVISQHPSNVQVAAGQPATFTVTATGTAPLSYQWQRNSSNISGANSASYTLSSPTASDNNAQFRCIVSNSAGSATSNAGALTVISGSAPIATITSPTSGSLYSGGDIITYFGTGSDNEDGTLAASRFTWDVTFHHGTHTHPFLAPFSGVTGGTFEIPRVGHSASDVWYRIRLTVTDSSGLSHTVFRDINPRLSTFTLATNPSGLTLNLDGQPKATPLATVGVVGTMPVIEAPLTIASGGNEYQFVSWSDGGAAQHAITVPTTNTTYTATYAAIPITYVSDLPYASTPVNGYGPVEKNTSNGSSGTGDGRTITLNGVTYSKGLGVHANSTVIYNLGGQYSEFISDVGVDDEKSSASVVFQVWVDGVKLFDSGTMGGSTTTKTARVNVAGKNQLRLVVTDAGDGITNDHADWAGARLTGGGSPPPPPPPPPPSGTTFIAPSTSWKYLDNGSNQGTSWRGTTFSDSTWKTGNAQLGYGDGDEATVVSYGSSSSNKYITTYFRKAFTVSDPAAVTALTMRLVRDDGAVVYLNGTEVFRNNITSGTVAYNTLANNALGGSDETAWLSASVNRALLVTGTNVIAVEIHQSDVTSSDISFNFELTGTVASSRTSTTSALASGALTVPSKYTFADSDPTSAWQRLDEEMD